MIGVPLQEPCAAILLYFALQHQKTWERTQAKQNLLFSTPSSSLSSFLQWMARRRAQKATKSKLTTDFQSLSNCSIFPLGKNALAALKIQIVEWKSSLFFGTGFFLKMQLFSHQLLLWH